MRYFRVRPLAASILAALLFFSAATAQTQPAPQGPSPLNAAAVRVKSQVDQQPVGGSVTVQMLDGKEYYGNLHRIGRENGRKTLMGGRVHPHRALITTLIVVGVLLTITFVAVAGDKS